MARKLKREDLCYRCDPGLFKFKDTRELPPYEGTIGQERALRSIDFGVSLQSRGFNIYVLGESGTGKTSTVKSIISRKASTEPVPPDWCYVYNFAEPDHPLAISLPPGKGVELRKDMEELISSLKTEIPKVFESKEYEKQKNRIMEEYQKRQKDLFASLEEEAEAKGFTIKRTVGGFFIVPVKKNGEVLSEEEFNNLDENTKKKIEELGRMLQEKLDDVVRALKAGEKIVKELLKKLEREAALSVLGEMIDEIKAKHEGNEKLLKYLEDVKEDILDNLEFFKSQSEETQPPLPFMKVPKQEPSFNKYTVNVIVNNANQKGAPCVFESNPTYYNLFGRIEHKFQYGVAVTDFSMIKPGALHKANGGYLVIHALDLLRNLFSYDALKRAIRNREVKIEDIWEQYRLVTSAMLKPEPIPLNVKVILIGNPYIYYLLYNLDEEYNELFKVKADFDSRMERTDETTMNYASFVATKAKEENLLPFDPTGVARIVEYGSRLAEHQMKLSSKFSEISDIIREAHYWAQKDGDSVVKGEHVERAIEEKIYRHNRIEERMREMMAEGTLIVDTEGEKVGQINGLAVLSLGDYSFGKPSRITTNVYTGKAGVLNIERETKMSGKIHEKAILILSNYLGKKYATKHPISLSASITFEQLYGMIEGDSATCAELYSLLSAISGVPIKQSIAITGSMDQNGIVQPIGGVNEKIEGFFDLCKLRGLDGSHGVIIPSRNIKNLMLKREVIQAVEDGKFHIYAIDHIDEGVEILMGIPAGEMDEDGNYPEGTLHFLVSKRLSEIREALKGKKEKEKEGEEDGNNNQNENKK
ncbi:MAG: ATP-dependent protease [Nitrospirae bacterium]|nr:MAG: ATP-dependent protease [Nitrospirota bacterium]